MLDKNRRIQLYNTLTKRKELFKPVTKGHVGIYCCGPTVYSDPHLGHAKSAIAYDVLVRFLRYIDYKVRYVRNITDVGHLTDDGDDGEDKIIKRAQIEKMEPMELVEFYLKRYLDAVDKLNVLRPNIAPHASAYIPEQINAVQILINKGYAYETDGSVYFDIKKFSKYGKLSARKVEQQKAGARIEINNNKKHPADFALWKKADPKHILKWRSPWGYGFPGWHIECSVMSMKFLGNTLDIHGGGIDLQFPHHECEIAQSESITGVKFVNYWLHNNMVTVEGIKMSKSLGNFTTIKDLTDKYDPIYIRYFILSSHYRSILDFNENGIIVAANAVKKLSSYFAHIENAFKNNVLSDGTINKNVKFRIDRLLEDVLESLSDDLNTPQVLASLFGFFKEHSYLIVNIMQENKSTIEYMHTVLTDIFQNILGLSIVREQDLIQSNVNIKEVISTLDQIRNKLRNKGFFEESDLIRNSISKLGVNIDDDKL